MLIVYIDYRYKLDFFLKPFLHTCAWYSEPPPPNIGTMDFSRKVEINHLLQTPLSVCALKRVYYTERGAKIAENLEIDTDSGGLEA